MRCWHPRAEQVVSHVKNFNPDEIILMPLYPQYSAATSGSSIKEWKDICKKNNLKVKTSTICCYPTDDNFVQAHKEEIIKKINTLNNFKLIFSAHGLPEKNIKKGDPYQWQVEQSVNKIVKSLNIENLDWVLSYQSRVGPLKWIGPSTENIIVENSQLGKHIVLVPIAFVSEHSETLVELDIEYKELADKNGCKNYTRVPALGTNENYIKAMSNLIIKKQDYNFNGELFPPKIQCPNQFIKCPCLNYE
jgi:ferrochelatase